MTTTFPLPPGYECFDTLAEHDLNHSIVAYYHAAGKEDGDMVLILRSAVFTWLPLEEFSGRYMVSYEREASRCAS